MRWELGPLGYPVPDEMTTPEGIAANNRFSKSGGGIYWTSTTGARAIHGAIEARWASLGWERRRLGHPTTGEYAIPGG